MLTSRFIRLSSSQLRVARVGFKRSLRTTSIDYALEKITPEHVTHILRKDEFKVARQDLPPFLDNIECNQLASNSPIEDRIRISSLQIPGQKEPTILLGVFDGHGGVTTADLVTRRLFNYIGLSLSSERIDLKDLHHSPPPKHDPALRPDEIEALQNFKNQLYSEQESSNVGNNKDGTRIIQNLKASFRQCDDDLSREIQRELTSSQPSHAALHYYLSAAVSGCCGIVLVLQEDKSYIATVGDCRAVLGSFTKVRGPHIGSKENTNDYMEQGRFFAKDLLDEHNCYNRSESRRLIASHPASEQNTIVKHNRLLGHLMPFRAFGDFNYKWSAEVIKRCGLTRAYGNSVIPAHYETPPYLISEPDIREIDMKQLDEIDLDSSNQTVDSKQEQTRCIVMATDGLWELFETSRDVIEAISKHSRMITLNADGQLSDSDNQQQDFDSSSVYYDKNSATHLLRSALTYGSQPTDCTMDIEELNRLQHARLEAMLTLPKSIARNFRDDISMIIVKLRNKM